MTNEKLHTDQVLQSFAKNVISHARSNLTRKGKRVGNTLYDSLGYTLNVSKNSFGLEFEAAEYADFVDQGVSGTEKKYNTPFSFRDKMPPRKFILQWVNAKRLRLRGEKGRFKKGGQKSLAFLIQRSIYQKGIKPSLFFTNPFNAAFEGLPDDLIDAYVLDEEAFIETTFRNHLKQ